MHDHVLGYTQGAELRGDAYFATAEAEDPSCWRWWVWARALLIVPASEGQVGTHGGAVLESERELVRDESTNGGSVV